MQTQATEDRNALPSLPLCSERERYTYHVISSAAPMPSSCKGVYKRVAVLRVDHHERPIGYKPERIAEVRGVEIIDTWERLNVGSTERCAYRRALADARVLAQKLARASAKPD